MVHALKARIDSTLERGKRVSDVRGIVEEAKAYATAHKLGSPGRRVGQKGWVAPAPPCPNKMLQQKANLPTWPVTLSSESWPWSSESSAIIHNRRTPFKPCPLTKCMRLPSACSRLERSFVGRASPFRCNCGTTTRPRNTLPVFANTAS
jgi:hypothetical protein